ncbi:MAG: sarcosine oxidase subunit delta [Brachybacterium sp.]|nr:sarcosine oxidase subunit delta [Brachybacterium sp.]
MLLIDCPHCGPRNEVEFHYGGQAHVAYPEDPAALDDRAWGEFLFYRENPKGPFAERWQHAVGCRKWFNAVRDTRTYEFLAVYPLGAEPPALPDDENQPGRGAATATDAADPDRAAAADAHEPLTDRADDTHPTGHDNGSQR